VEELVLLGSLIAEKKYVRHCGGVRGRSFQYLFDCRSELLRVVWRHGRYVLQLAQPWWLGTEMLQDVLIVKNFLNVASRMKA
jgi:hypothetical protein